MSLSIAGIEFGAATTALSLEHALRSAVILTVFLMLLFTSIANVVVLWCRFNEVISIYLISLSMADLLCALFVIPFSLYSSLRPGWAFAGDNSILCKCTVYAHMVLLASTVFTFAWISVDRYAAFMKPSRYEVAHTMTRCKCWILFSWVTSLLLACPVLIAKMETNYSAQLELCLLNWSSTMAYSTTVGVLVLLPSMCTVALTSTAIVSAMNKPEELEDLQRSILETDQNFAISLFILVSFLLSWLPLIIFQFLPPHLLDQADSAVMRFAFTWLAIGGGSSKLLIYSFTSKQFRHALCCCFLERTGRNSPARPPSDLEDRPSASAFLPNSATASSSTNNQMQQSNQQLDQQQPLPPPKETTAAVQSNARSPIAYSFLSAVNYGSFGLGPTGGGFLPQQQNHSSSPCRDSLRAHFDHAVPQHSRHQKRHRHP